jgi:hypothetical protein
MMGRAAIVCAVAARIVKQDDVPAALRSGLIVAGRATGQDSREDIIDDRGNARMLPVLAIHMQAHRDVAAILGFQTGRISSAVVGSASPKNGARNNFRFFQ